MMREETSTGQASHKFSNLFETDRRRMLEYKRFAMALSYPDDNFFTFFPALSTQREALVSEYDRLFRANEVWLYGAEHLAENEFQRTHYLSDIMGFYRAFGLVPNNDRPDSLSSELEFMHYLIFKKKRAIERSDSSEESEKADICLDAQKKFFKEHLYPAVGKIVKAVTVKGASAFYIELFKEMLSFLKREKELLEV